MMEHRILLYMHRHSSILQVQAGSQFLSSMKCISLKKIMTATWKNKLSSLLHNVHALAYCF